LVARTDSCWGVSRAAPPAADFDGDGDQDLAIASMPHAQCSCELGGACLCPDIAVFDGPLALCGL
jgi:hypothetical protein